MTDEPLQLEPWFVAWANAARNCDALLFAVGVLGFLMPGDPNPDKLPQLDKWQVKALKLFSKRWRDRMTKPPRIAIKAGHGVGKTCFLSIIILFVLLCSPPDTKVPVVAAGMDQLRDALWPEISKWIQKLPDALQNQVDWQKEKIVLKEFPEESFAVARTASKNRPEAIQGLHAKTMLVIGEEASGIIEETAESIHGKMSTAGSGMLCVGNPTRAHGFFHKIFTAPAMRAAWDRMTVNCEDVPFAQGHIQDVIRLYGKDSNKYRVRVLGEFPVKDDDTVIPLESIEAAKGRQVAMHHVYPVWGCDVARFGDDRTTLLKRQGNHLLAAPKVWRGLTNPQIVGRIMAEYHATENEMKPRAICVDTLNFGAGVVDLLKLDETLRADDVRIVAVNVSESAAVAELHHRLRDELWFAGRAWFAANDCHIPNENMNGEERALIEELITELCVPTYTMTTAGKNIVMSKDDMKKDQLLEGRSPDIADGFLLTFAAPVHPRPTERHRRRNHYEPANAWGS